MKSNLLQILTMINNASLAYFENQLERFGVDFARMIPLNKEQENIFKGISHNFTYPMISQNIVNVEFSSAEKFEEIFTELRLEEFIRKYFFRQLKKAAIYFTRIYRKFPNSQFIFSQMGEQIPFRSVENYDPETHIIFRLLHGSEIFKYNAILIISICFYIIPMDTNYDKSH
jgi:hypothetical protein